MQIEMDLKDETKAREQIKKVQTAIDDLLSVCNDQKMQLIANTEVITESEKHIRMQEGTIKDLTNSIKAIYRVLNAKKDLWKNDKEINEIQESLKIFVLGSGAIKAGVTNEPS